MNCASIRFCCAGVLSIPLLAATPLRAQDAQTAAAAQPDDNTKARDLYREGARLYGSGKYEEARAVLLEAWTIRHTYDVAAALGQVEIELGRYRDAAEHLDFGIRNFAPVENEQSLQQAKAAFENVKKRVGILTVEVDKAGAEIRVDGDPAGTSPLGAPVFVETGPHNIEARLDDRSATQRITAVAGKEEHLSLTLGSAPPPVSAGLEQSSSSSSSSSAQSPQNSEITEDRGIFANKNLVPVYVGGAVALVGLGTGLGFHFAAESKDNEAESLRAKVGRNGCGAGNPALASDCNALMDAAEAKDRDRNLSTAGFVVGGLALVATAGYFFLWPEESGSAAPTARTTPRIRVSGEAGPRTAKVWLAGEF